MPRNLFRQYEGGSEDVGLPRTAIKLRLSASCVVAVISYSRCRAQSMYSVGSNSVYPLRLTQPTQSRS
jgi:hypothetical protein